MFASQTQGQGNPAYQGQFQGQPNGVYTPYAQGAQGVTPQGFDFGSIISTVAQGAAQALPGLLMGLLSADPQVQQQLARQGITPQGATPQLYGTQQYGAGQYGAQQAGVNPQGFDFGSIISTVAQGAAQALPGLLMGLLSSDPQIQQQLGRQGLNPQSAMPSPYLTQQYGAGQLGMQQAGVNPQGFDIGSILRSVAQRAAQSLPGLLTQLLSADPQIQQIASQSGVSPQSLFNFGVQTPFGGAGLSMFGAGPQVAGQQGIQQGTQQWGTQQYGNVNPQFLGISNVVTAVTQRALQALPGILSHLLSSDPQIQQLQQATRQGSGVNPQGLFNFGVNTPFGGAGLSMFDANPQMAAQQGAQQWGNVNPQFNIGGIFRSVAQRAAQALPGLLTQLLSADPQIQQIQQATRQGGGVNPQGLFNFGVNTPFGGAGLSIFDAPPQVQQQAGQQWGTQQWAGGQPQQQPASVTPQSIDLRGLAQNLASILAPQLPGIVSTILTQTLGNQAGTPVTVH